MDFLVNMVELITAISPDHFVLQRHGPVQRPAVESQPLVHRQHVGGRVETVQIAQQEPEGVANPTVGIGGTLQDFIGYADFPAIVGGGHPQTQNIGAQDINDFLRGDDVAQRLRHLPTVFVDRETVRQHLPVRRLAIHRHRSQ
ncbi:hypothetical protein MnTg04_01498 [bacterium MnTg04]|nr:hypothetical protein MnTg04_01498 [bacterium MnTg04]